MTLVVLGANGRTGRHVVEMALGRGLAVTAVVRSVNRAPTLKHDRLSVAVGDPCDPAFLKQILVGHDTVISALGGRAPTKAATSVYPRSAEALAAAAWDTGLSRVLVTSTALLFPDQTAMGKILRFAVPQVTRSAQRMENTLAASALTWTVARPGFLTSADTSGYRATRNGLPQNGTSVSRRALAGFLVDAINAPKTFKAVYGVSDAT